MSPILRLLRPHQWSKSTVCLAGVFFSGKWVDPNAVMLALLTFAVFSITSSAVYIYNDICDVERDRLHAVKRNRPLANGSVGLPTARILLTVMVVLGLVGGTVLGGTTLILLLLYLLNNLAYSHFLKHQPIWDVGSIAFGFVLRLVAGVYVVGELPTAWIVLTTFFLAMFLGFAKRRAELSGLDQSIPSQRPVLKSYSLEYLEHMVTASATMAVLSYGLFTVLSGKNPALVLTLPFVYYAISHYTRLVIVGARGEEPEKTLVTSPHIVVAVACWLSVYLAIEIFDPIIFK